MKRLLIIAILLFATSVSAATATWTHDGLNVTGFTLWFYQTAAPTNVYNKSVTGAAVRTMALDANYVPLVGDTIAKWKGTATGQLSSTDKNGTAWHSPPSIGAYEYGARPGALCPRGERPWRGDDTMNKRVGRFDWTLKLAAWTGAAWVTIRQ